MENLDINKFMEDKAITIQRRFPDSTGVIASPGHDFNFFLDNS